MIKAIGFDVGHTLIKYNSPLNWSSLYRPALEQVLTNCNIDYCDKNIETAISILAKYNTRVNYREVEYSSDIIFSEIFDLLHIDPVCMNKAKKSFYMYFIADAVPFIDVEPVLKKLKSGNFKIGVLTDVAYGMDNEFSLEDINSISKYIDAALTSVDVGFRKPNSRGFQMLSEALDVKPSQMLYIGDEEKDVIGANKAGIGSVLLNRNNEELCFGQSYTINSLNEIFEIL